MSRAVESAGSVLILKIEKSHDLHVNIRAYLKNRILAQDRGGAELSPLSGTSHLILKSLWVETGGILLYVEDLK